MRGLGRLRKFPEQNVQWRVLRSAIRRSTLPLYVGPGEDRAHIRRRDHHCRHRLRKIVELLQPVGGMHALGSDTI